MEIFFIPDFYERIQPAKEGKMSSARAIMVVLTVMLGWAISGYNPRIGFAAEVNAQVSQNFEGVISRVNHKEVVIDNVTFRLKPIADLDLSRFAPGTYVSFRLNADGMVVALTPIKRPDQIDGKRFYGPTTTAPEATPAIQPKAQPSSSTHTPSPNSSQPVKRHDGVWTN